MATDPSNPESISKVWFGITSDIGRYETTFPLVIPAAKTKGAETSSAASYLGATKFNNPDASVQEDFASNS